MGGLAGAYYRWPQRPRATSTEAKTLNPDIKTGNDQADEQWRRLVDEHKLEPRWVVVPDAQQGGVKGLTPMT